MNLRVYHSKRTFLASAIVLISGIAAHAADATWNVDANGDWNVATNWNPITFPNGVGEIANLTNDITANRTITIPTGVPITIGTLNIGDPAATFGAFTVASGGAGGTLTLDSAAGNALINKAASASTLADVISAPIILNDSLTVTNNSTTAGLTISGPISQSGGAKFLLKLGAGTVTLNGANTYSDATVVDAGTLRYDATGTQTGGIFRIGSGASNIGNLDVAGGTISSALFVVGSSGTGTVTNSGTINTNGSTFVAGDFTGGNGTFTQSAGSLTTGLMLLGRVSSGTMNINGGSVTTGTFVLSDQPTGVGTYTQTAGSLTTGLFLLGRVGTSTMTVSGGTVNTTAGAPFILGDASGGNGIYNNNGGSLTSGDAIIVGQAGTGTFTVNSGTVATATAKPFLIGNFGGTTATYAQTGGTVTIPDWFVVGVSGTGHGTQNSATEPSINNSNVFTLGQNNLSNGDYVLNAGTINTNVLIPGLAGKGEFTLNGGALNIGIFSNVGEQATGDGTVNINGGALSTSNQWSIGLNGKGKVVQTAGNAFVGTDLNIAENANSTGSYSISGGSLITTNVLRVGFRSGAAFTQNGGLVVTAANGGFGPFVIGDTATANGTFTQNHGDLLVVNNAFISGASGTGNATILNDSDVVASTLIAGNSSGSNGTITINNPTGSVMVTDIVYSSLPTVVPVASTGTVSIGSGNGSIGTLNQIAGTVSVGSQTYIGNFGNGKYNMSGGTYNAGDSVLVGVNSGSVGLVTMTNGTVNVNGTGVGIGVLAGSTGTYNLSGGALNVTGTSGGIAAGPGTAAFNFTGGTLKVKIFNDTTVLGGNLGDLKQNGAGSLLDVTGNDTIIHANYDLGSGTATIGAGRTLTIDNGMINSAGTGIVNVNSGGALISNNIRTETLNMNSGVATIRTNGGTAGASKVETLNMTGTSKLNLKDNDLVVGTGTVAAVRAQIKTGVAGAVGITSDLPAFGVSTGFGYALGNDAAISPLLAGSLTGQSYDADSVLVKYTYLGDADLDGDSDLNDLGLWAQSFTGDLGNPAIPVTFWTSGDFDYDGDTDLNDLGFWAGTFTGDLGGGAGSLIVNAPGAPAGAVAALNSMGITVVPEPSTFVLAGVGLAGLAIAARRKRSS